MHKKAINIFMIKVNTAIMCRKMRCKEMQSNDILQKKNKKDRKKERNRRRMIKIEERERSRHTHAHTYA